MITKTCRLEGIPGTFTDERVKSIRFHGHNDWLLEDHARKAGADFFRVYVADVHDGMLQAFVGHEPIDPGGGLLWHLSLSHKSKEFVCVRLPTYDELKLARYRLIREAVPMAMIFPSNAENFVNANDWVLHLWQVPSEWEL